jgi:hypothetical protein
VSLGQHLLISPSSSFLYLPPNSGSQHSTLMDSTFLRFHIQVRSGSVCFVSKTYRLYSLFLQSILNNDIQLFSGIRSPCSVPKKEKVCGKVNFQHQYAECQDFYLVRLCALNLRAISKPIFSTVK